MKEINQLRKAIRDYRRTKDTYAQFRESGWSSEFYEAHRQEIEDFKSAQAVYSMHEGRMPTLTELSAEYDRLKEQIRAEKTALEEMKPSITALKRTRHNCDLLLRDSPPKHRTHRRGEQEER